MQPVVVAVAEDGREPSGQVMQVLSGVVDVDDGGGFGHDGDKCQHPSTGHFQGIDEHAEGTSVDRHSG